MDIENHLPGDEPGTLVPSALRRGAEVMGVIGALLVLLLAVMINSDILSRLLVNRPVRGVAEMVELTIVVIVFIQLPLTVATGGLIRSSELHRRIGARWPGVGKAMTLAFELAGIVVFAALAWGLWPKFVDAWQDNLYKGQPGLFTVSTWPAILASVVGSAFSSVCFIVSFLRRLTVRVA